ncbi:hypothetical protein PHYSODRAFT_295321 [Phytophthora sojae]|uniref:Uncharacterized protein n=1 Tax=Phytophthora sojae (strain P6497) TaxID=1094619 RepID=G4YNQ8_PHYSP|nr:hypothetical protein PHYSODRAFT_295321 [Phytophthora sojae]EGZ30563.1 hypothetical protein PHYSODRAFT_295321 [Phytophthora sojae]|eukprot:XP_009517838.1 hypothetical protein PHYSODRAFT_295321 [Phytophthora sojae]
MTCVRHHGGAEHVYGAAIPGVVENAIVEGTLNTTDPLLGGLLDAVRSPRDRHLELLLSEHVVNTVQYPPDSHCVPKSLAALKLAANIGTLAGGPNRFQGRHGTTKLETGTARVHVVSPQATSAATHDAKIRSLLPSWTHHVLRRPRRSAKQNYALYTATRRRLSQRGDKSSGY